VRFRSFWQHYNRWFIVPRTKFKKCATGITSTGYDQQTIGLLSNTI
jgi:hypothetical protein